MWFILQRTVNTTSLYCKDDLGLKRDLLNERLICTPEYTELDTSVPSLLVLVGLYFAP